MKNIKKILIICAVILVVIFLAKDFIAKAVVETAVRAVAGVKLDLGKLKVGVFSSKVEIQDLKLHNPKEFTDKIMLDMPEIYVDYSLGKIITGKVDIEEIRIHLKEFLVIKDKDGKLNLDSLKVVQKQKEEKPKEVEKEDKGQSIKASDIAIRNLKLQVDKVIFKDYSKGGEPVIKEYNLNINEQYSDIKNLQAVASLIIVKVMTKTTIATLTNFDVAGLSSSLTGTLKGASGVALKAVDQTAGAAMEAVGTTTETLKKTGQEIKGLIKNPFGK